MSYLLNFNTTDDGDEGEDEVEVDNSFLLSDPNDILIDIPAPTANNLVPAYGPMISDPLADPLETGNILELQSSTAATPTLETVILSPPLEQQAVLEQNFKDKKFFFQEMVRNVEGAINESIKLLNMDPREYHPFYLRVFKYITIGQRHSHIPPGEKAALQFWKRYDKQAEEQWKSHQINPTPFDTEQSPYVIYALTRKVYINEKLVPQKRDEAARANKFRELERKARKILRENADYSNQSCDIRSNLELRLKFFYECLTMTHPADTIRMNRLWSHFCCKFNRQPVKLSESLQLNVDPTPSVDPAKKAKIALNATVKSLYPAYSSPPAALVETPLKTKISLKVKVKSPEPPDEDDDLPSPSYSPPPSPHVDDEPVVEQKYQIPVELQQDATTNASKNTDEDESEAKKTKRSDERVMIDDNDGVPKKKQKEEQKSELPKKLKLKMRNKRRLKTSLQGKGNIQLKKSKLVQSRLSLARKKLKVGMKQVTSSSTGQDKVLSVLEKKISSITLKLKKSKPLSRQPLKPSDKEAPSEKIQVKVDPALTSAKTTKPEFSMCEECGQTYRTHYLSVHKEAVHNPNNTGMQCPLCPQNFKRGAYLWAHVLGSHMPDHLNPGKLAMEVEPVVEKARSLSNPPPPPPPKDNSDSSFTTKIEKTGSTWNCPHCNDKPFSTKATLQRHLHLIHGEGSLPENKLVCSQCPKSFKEKATLDQHFRREHEGIENRCDICSKKFQTPGKLWKHRVDSHNIIGERPQRKYLESVQCEHCGENCLYGKQFINHVKNHHPDMLEETLRQLKRRQLDKKREAKRKRKIRNKLIGKKESGVDYMTGGPKECPECGKILKGNLSRHLTQFHGIGDGVIKTYICPVAECSKKYKSRVSLRVHISENHDPVNEKIASKQLIKVLGVSPSRIFECTLCGWKVSDRHECMVHLLVGHPHCLEDENDASGFLAIKCPHCEQTARTQDQIRNHVEVFHPDQVWRCPHPECGKVILGPVDLQEHFHQDHGEGNEDEGTYLGSGRRKIKGKSVKSRAFNRKRRVRRTEIFTHKRTPGIFPCHRCDKFSYSVGSLDSHVKETHPEAYWPCKECGAMCFTQRSNLFHQSTLCKVKRQIGGTGQVVGFDQIVMECQICGGKVKSASFLRHLKLIHGVVENGDLWKCEYCFEDMQTFRRREYWLAHMDDRHGGEIDIEELIDVARQINTLEEVDLEKLKTVKKATRGVRGPHRSRMSGGVKKAMEMLNRGRKGKRGRRPSKKKKLVSSDSEGDENKFGLDGDKKEDTEFKVKSQKKVPELKLVLRRDRLKRHHREVSPVKEIDIADVMSNVPLEIRRMFEKQCSVHVEKLSSEQIEMYKRSR